MKGFIIAISILSGLSLPAQASGHPGAQGNCYPRWYIGSNTYGGNEFTRAAMTLDTVIDAEESLWITLSSQVLCENECSMEAPPVFAWTHNGESVSSENYLVEDTGTYIGSIKYAACGPGYFRITLHIRYKAAPVVSDVDNAVAELYLYPTLSTGVFNIKAGEALTKIQIRDCSGNIVYSESKNISMIDISHLKEGVYFYYLEDRSRHSRVGKLVKR
jgi:hypothetical protein